MTSGYYYKKGFKPYKHSLDELTPRVRYIINALVKESNMSKIARQAGVSRCFVWQVFHRLEATKEYNNA